MYRQLLSHYRPFNRYDIYNMWINAHNIFYYRHEYYVWLIYSHFVFKFIAYNTRVVVIIYCFTYRCVEVFFRLICCGTKNKRAKFECCIGICGEAELTLGTYNQFASQQPSKTNTPQTMVSVFNIMYQQWRIIRCMEKRSLSFFSHLALRENIYSYMNGYWK